MSPDGGQGAVELSRDLLIGQARCGQGDDLTLAGCEVDRPSLPAVVHRSHEDAPLVWAPHSDRASTLGHDKRRVKRGAPKPAPTTVACTQSEAAWSCYASDIN